jgi:hypothetical protein
MRRGFLTAVARVRSQGMFCEFVVDEVRLRQVFAKCFRFPCQVSLHQLIQSLYLSAGIGKICPLVTGVQSRLSLTLHHKIRRNLLSS